MMHHVAVVAIAVVAMILAAISMARLAKIKKASSGEVRDNADTAYNSATGLLVFSLMGILYGGLQIFGNASAHHSLGEYFD